LGNIEEKSYVHDTFKTIKYGKNDIRNIIDKDFNDGTNKRLLQRLEEEDNDNEVVIENIDNDNDNNINSSMNENMRSRRLSQFKFDTIKINKVEPEILNEINH